KRRPPIYKLRQGLRQGQIFIRNRIYPAGNYLCIAFLGLFVVVMSTMYDLRLSAMLLRVWVVLVFIAFKLSRKK
ncbi:hypothetical protein ACVGV9_23545, partial [Enterobacter hormaechei]